MGSQCGIEPTNSLGTEQATSVLRRVSLPSEGLDHERETAAALPMPNGTTIATWPSPKQQA